MVRELRWRVYLAMLWYMTIIVIDDERTFEFGPDHAPVMHVRNSSDALSILARLHINQQLRYAPALDELWLDHDLGMGSNGVQSISDVVDFLCLVKLDIRYIYVHSQNPTVDWMVTVLRRAGYNAHRSALPQLVG